MYSRRVVSRFFHILAFCSLAISPVAQADVSHALLEIQERMFLEQRGDAIFSDATIYQPAFVDHLYTASGYEPVWTDAGYAQEMLGLLKASADEGLNPADYHYRELLELKAEYADAWSDQDRLRAKAEVLLTDGLLLYARHLIEGKVDPRTLDDSWNYSRRNFDPETVAQSLLQAIRERRVAQVLEGLKPQVDFYQRMKRDLSKSRRLAENAQFTPVPDDTVLRPGQSHANVSALRQRLQQMGYLASNSGLSAQFDETLKQAVLNLQADEGLDVDAIVGRQSFAALNLPYSERVQRLRVNMDRLRWIAQDISKEFIVVNIAGYELYYIRDAALVWETPVMVGTIDTRTPIFHSPLKYMEFNPTWNAPRSIVGRSLLPKFQANPGYAAKAGYQFLDSSGRAVDWEQIDFKRYTPNTFPFRVVQKPGPANAMGQVKFIFPNRHAVYLHDTPSRALFSRSQRAFSAGCIRVKNPLDLAHQLLSDEGKWSRDKIQQLVDGAKPKQVVRMKRDIDVLLMYWTVSPAASGGLQFNEDVYQLDATALALLDSNPESEPFAIQ